MTEATLQFARPEDIPVVFGAQDKFLRQVRDAVGVRVILRGDEVRLLGSAEQIQRGLRVFRELQAIVKRRGELADNDVQSIIDGGTAAATLQPMVIPLTRSRGGNRAASFRPSSAANGSSTNGVNADGAHADDDAADETAAHAEFSEAGFPTEDDRLAVVADAAAMQLDAADDPSANGQIVPLNAAVNSTPFNGAAFNSTVLNAGDANSGLLPGVSMVSDKGSNGHGANGASSGGSNGASSNGSNGHAANGNGHAGNGHSANGNVGNGYTNGHSSGNGKIEFRMSGSSGRNDGHARQESGSRTNPPRGNDRLSGNGDSRVGSSSKRVTPRTTGQAEYVQAMRENDLVFCSGPAGSGKTYLAVAMAVNALRQELVRKIVLVRPAVEAGEKLGFLPGDMQAKVNPYMRPLLDALNELLDFETVKRYMERDVIEIAPLAFMRGRTLNETFIILDEGQNTTITQMQMFLTRLGNGSRIVVTGDTTQIDLPPGSSCGLIDAMKRLDGISGIAKVELSGKDIVRHRLVRDIVKAYEAEHSDPKIRQRH